MALSGSNGFGRFCCTLRSLSLQKPTLNIGGRGGAGQPNHGSAQALFSIKVLCGVQLVQRLLARRNAEVVVHGAIPIVRYGVEVDVVLLSRNIQHAAPKVRRRRTRCSMFVLGSVFHLAGVLVLLLCHQTVLEDRAGGRICVWIRFAVAPGKMQRTCVQCTWKRRASAGSIGKSCSENASATAAATTGRAACPPGCLPCKRKRLVSGCL